MQELSIDRQGERALSVIRRGTVAALASVSDGKPGLCAVFYVRLGGSRLAFKSRRSSEHMRAFGENPNGAMLIYSHASTYASKLGIQLRGAVRRASDALEMKSIVRQYSHCFEGAGKKLGNPEDLLLERTESTFFVFDAESYKLVDESPSGNLTMPFFSSFVELVDHLKPEY